MLGAVRNHNTENSSFKPIILYSCMCMTHPAGASRKGSQRVTGTGQEAAALRCIRLQNHLHVCVADPETIKLGRRRGGCRVASCPAPDLNISIRDKEGTQRSCLTGRSGNIRHNKAFIEHATRTPHLDTLVVVPCTHSKTAECQQTTETVLAAHLPCKLAISCTASS
jgi:hypothetical protein